jgi:hypothetical protein
MLIVNATFRLAEGITEAEFLAADARFQEDFAYQQKGMMRRLTARSENGSWLVMTMWDSAESSTAAGSSTAGAEAVAEMHRCIDFSTHVIEQYFTF